MSQKSSSVGWTSGIFPSTWKKHRAQYLFRRLRLSSNLGSGVVTAFRDGQVTLRANRREEGFTFATKEIGYQGVRAGDLVIHSMDGFAGAVGVSDSTGRCSPVYVVCEPKSGVDVRYYSYVVREMASSGYITSLAKGIRERSTSFGWTEFKVEWLPFPPRHVQKTIADFLDRKTAAIDALIEKKQKLLGLLAEKRAALINQAVTKGLDPNVPMKDSGIPWIGETPAHWKLCRLKYATKLFRGRFTHRPRNDPRLYGGPYPFLQTGDIARADRYIINFSQTLNEQGLRASLKFPPNTIVMAIAANVGDVAITRFDACFPDSVIGFNPSGLISTEYLFVLLEGMRSVLIEHASENTQKNLNIELVGNLIAPLPPLDEQLSLVSLTDGFQQKVSTIRNHLEIQVARLKEYRQALITAAVTGQLDIPEPAT